MAYSLSRSMITFTAALRIGAVTFTAAPRIATAILKTRKIITRPTSTDKNPCHQTEHSATETTVSHPRQCIYHLKLVRIHPVTITQESIESKGVTQEHQDLAVTQPCVAACRLDCNEKAPYCEFPKGYQENLFL